MFYKLLDNNELTFGQYVHSESYTLVYELKDTYTLPIDGWYWFDNKEEANTFFFPPEE